MLFFIQSCSLFSECSFFSEQIAADFFYFRSSSNRKMDFDPDFDDEEDVDDSENEQMRNSDSSFDLVGVSNDETIKATDIITNNPIVGVQSSADKYFAKDKKRRKQQECTEINNAEEQSLFNCVCKLCQLRSCFSMRQGQFKKCHCVNKMNEPLRVKLGGYLVRHARLGREDRTMNLIKIIGSGLSSEGEVKATLRKHRGRMFREKKGQDFIHYLELETHTCCAASPCVIYSK